MRGDDRRAGASGDGQVVGVGEAADVVAHDRAGRGRGEHHRPPGVDAERDVEAGVQGLDGGDDPLELLVLAHLGPRSGLHAADVEQVGALGDELVGPAQEVVEGEVATLVEERVGRPVEDAHHERTVGDVETCHRGRRPARAGR